LFSSINKQDAAESITPRQNENNLSVFCFFDDWLDASRASLSDFYGFMKIIGFCSHAYIFLAHKGISYGGAHIGAVSFIRQRRVF